MWVDALPSVGRSGEHSDPYRRLWSPDPHRRRPRGRGAVPGKRQTQAQGQGTAKLQRAITSVGRDLHETCVKYEVQIVGLRGVCVQAKTWSVRWTSMRPVNVWAVLHASKRVGLGLVCPCLMLCSCSERVRCMICERLADVCLYVFFFRAV